MLSWGVALGAAHALGALATSRTFFQPDEYWQTLEIAHRIVFGYGYQTWEWRGEAPIRSVVHPALFVPLYAVLKETGLDSSAYLMAVIATAGDVAFFRLARRLGGEGLAYAWAIVHLLSMYGTYTYTRPFSNSTEAALCSIALLYWPLTPAAAAHGSLLVFDVGVFAAFAAVLLRPTSLLLWAFLGGKALRDAAQWGGAKRAAALVAHAACVGSLVLCAGIALDSWYYGERVVTVWNFFYENVVQSLSVFYGAHPWDWYLSQGLPLILTVAMPWAQKGWLNALNQPSSSAMATLGGLCAWTVGAYSLLSHKEARFLQPLLPIFHLFAASAIAPPSGGWRTAWRAFPRALRFLLLAQVPVTLYLAAFHAKGQIEVVQYVHAIATHRTTFGFLMPCHSTPWQSHMHARVLEMTDMDSELMSGDVGRAWFLACPPPRNKDPATYWDQSDFFFADPVRYLRDRFPARVDTQFPPMRQYHFHKPRPTNATDAVSQHVQSDLGWRHTWPSHLVLYTSLLDMRESDGGDTVGAFLRRRGYVETRRIWNALSHPDWNRRGDIVVLQFEDERTRFFKNHTVVPGI